MVNTIEKKYSYYSFGLNICSDFIFPELNKSIKLNQSEIHIKKNDLTNLWFNVNDGRQKFVVKDQNVIFKVSNTGIFCVRNGDTILVCPEKNVDEDKLRLYILGSCMGILLLQRWILPLHGSVVEIKGKAFAFIGHSGAGKSTIASAFKNRGYKLLTDDVIAISLNNDNKVVVTPSYPQQKLWESSLDCFGLNTSDFTPLFERENKFAVPVISNFHATPLPLAGIFELVKTDHGQITATPIEKLEKIATLYRHTYRNFLVSKLNMIEWHFNMATKISNQINLYNLQRPSEGFTAYDLVDLVLDIVNKEDEI